MDKLTERQKEVYNYIKGYIDNYRFSPSIRDIAEHFSITVKGVQDHLKYIEKKKYIKRQRKARSIVILK